MIDPNILKENPESLKENLKRRNLPISIDELNSLDQDRRKTRQEANEIRSEQKKLSNEISLLKGEEREKALEKASALSNLSLIHI